MKRFLLPLAAIAVAGLLLPAGARPAYACSCAVQSVEDYVANADVIVIGTVVQVVDATDQFRATPEKSEGTGIASVADIDAVVSVERYLKGAGPAEIVADDPPSGGSCGFLDESSLGQRYLLFLTGDASPFATHLCSGSTPLEGAQIDQERADEMLQEVRAITGPGTLPQDIDVPIESQTDDGIPWLPIILGSSLAAGVLAAAALLLRRRLTRG